MKTLKFLIILMCIGVFELTSVQAQNNVKKSESVTTVSGYLDCTGDWLGGYVIIENIVSPHNWVTLVKKVEVKGYLDEECTIPSGNVYEFSQVVTGGNFFENTGHFRLNGKIIAVFHQWFHMTTDGTVVNEGSRSDCK
jgi:hypothetical protein